MPSSNTCRFTALSMAVTVTMTSVAVTASGCESGQCAVALGGAFGVEAHGFREHVLNVFVTQLRLSRRDRIQLATT